jgi:8-amino-7-oxononanoate synthase
MDLFDKFKPLAAAYADLTHGGRDPFGVAFDRILSPTVGMIGDREVILAGTNNYLGLTFEPEVIAAAQEGAARYGTGTTGSRIANGTYGPHRALEAEMAAHFGMAGAIVFTTGSSSMPTVMPASMTPASCRARRSSASPIMTRSRSTGAWGARTRMPRTSW